MSEPKQVIIARKDLNMSPGKLAAQCSHASVLAFMDEGDIENNEFRMKLSQNLLDWIQGSFTKVVLMVNSEQELFNLYDEAQNKLLPRAIVKDEGRIELNGQHHTVVAIGPVDADVIDSITGHLKLYR